MPNYCDNFLTIDGNPNTRKKILTLLKSDETCFDFEKIVPMPDYIYRGAVGINEKNIYGENNWYDWSIKNWGTKWNSVDAEVDDSEIRFLTAWSPCDPVIAALAKKFPMMRFTYSFYEPGMCFCGQRIYENGEIIFYYDGDYSENSACNVDEEWANDYIIEDALFPIMTFGFYTMIQSIEDIHGGYVRGELHHREYEFGKIYRKTDGFFVGTKDYTEQLTEALDASNSKVA